MIDFDSDIKSRHSIANILLGENISVYLQELYQRYDVEIREYDLPNGETRTAYFVDKTLTVATLKDGTIFSLGCNEHYPGTYQRILATGMQFGEIAKITNRQRIFNGSIIINEDFGFSYTLPSPYDEIADSIQSIPLDLVMNEIFVADFSSWKK